MPCRPTSHDLASRCAVTEEIDGAGAFCELCGVRQPRRCKHCHDCGRCVAVFDHHCAWLGNCVGARNRCV